ncbi:Putative protein of unknown function [Podospora comata]|uniref:Uncharacterized protein n=1 Tax=Podospora comata TaxID=48703 RepID=A0ABY6S4F1_PODCO|nr:Putative protein of unknown function [Podospora comata]
MEVVKKAVAVNHDNSDDHDWGEDGGSDRLLRNEPASLSRLLSVLITRRSPAPFNSFGDKGKMASNSTRSWNGHFWFLTKGPGRGNEEVEAVADVVEDLIGIVGDQRENLKTGEGFLSWMLSKELSEERNKLAKRVERRRVRFGRVSRRVKG